MNQNESLWEYPVLQTGSERNGLYGRYRARHRLDFRVEICVNL
jgi:hypothetical protein